MRDDNIELSRRKILAGIGAVGAAGAGAGLGTSALFSDSESFEGNTITAGTLDLKVDWEEHYSYPQQYGFPDPTVDLDVTRSEPEDPENYQELPDPENPAVWVHDDDLSAYMDNTAIEAYPDLDDDGVQDDFNTDGIGDVCTDGADTDEDLDPSGFRTDNADTQGEEGGAPLVNLQDVKPGDFGELTLSFHLCNNPGYVWLGGELVEAAENGHTEPEGSADGESGPADEVVTDLGQGDDVELLDEIETTVWYDDGDNVLGDGGTETDEVDVMIVLDVSGSMDDIAGKFESAKSGAQTLVNELGPGAEVGLVSFNNVATVDEPLGASRSDINTTIGNLTAGGGTNMSGGISMAQNELTGPNGRSGADKVMVVLGNGLANGARSAATSAKNAGTTMYAIAYGSDADENLMEDVSSPPKVDDGTITTDDEFAFQGGQADIGDIFEGIGQQISSGEEVIFRGSLRETLTELESGEGIGLDANTSTEEQACFQPSTTHYVGMAWHLPADATNEVQSDSVSFDVGFYTEQCRNNDEPA